MTSAMAISVVIPTYRRSKLLLRCLDALRVQQFPHDRFEIVIADDAADPELEALIHSRFDGTRPVIQYQPVYFRHGPAVARNHGWRRAKGDVIAFTDDDCIPDSYWLQKGWGAFQYKISAAWGRLIMPLPEQPTDYEYNAARLAEAPFVTANCFCQRHVLEKLGGFDERYRYAWREDSDLYFRLMENGYIVARVDDAKVLHPILPERWGISLSQQKKSLYDALLFKSHPQNYRRWVGAAPWNYYAILAGLLVVLGGVLLQQKILILIGAGVWIGFTARFVYRRLKPTSLRWSHIGEMIVTSILIPPWAIFWRLRGAVKYRVRFL